MKVKIKKLNGNAVIPFKKHDDDFCYDLVATSCEEIAPNVYKYGTGLAFEIVSNDKLKWGDRLLNVEEFNYALTIRPRSSICKTGMVLSNSEGTIDFSYRGEVSAVFYHVMPDMPRYNVGDRIAQLHLDITCKIKFKEAEDLSSTERGTDGYGSTGK